VLQHEWKNGSPWLSGDFADLRHSVLTASPLTRLLRARPTAHPESVSAAAQGSGPADVRPDNLIATMEVDSDSPLPGLLARPVPVTPVSLGGEGQVCPGLWGHPIVDLVT
jgi:hypothetical protein